MHLLVQSNLQDYLRPNIYKSVGHNIAVERNVVFPPLVICYNFNSMP